LTPAPIGNQTVAPPVIAPAQHSDWRRLLGWAALLGAVLVVAAALLIPRLRRRRSVPDGENPWFSEESIDPPASAPEGALEPRPAPATPKLEPAAEPEPALFRAAAPAAPAASADPPAVELRFRARRAGMTLTGAAVDYALDLHNRSTEPVSDVRVDIRLLTASEQQDQVIAAAFAAPIERPAVAPFDLPGRNTIDLGGMAMLPHDVLTILTMQVRRFFVPMVAIRAVYRRADGREEQATSVQVIGIDRGAQAKMAPFRVDVPPRMYDNVTQRVHVPKG